MRQLKLNTVLEHITDNWAGLHKLTVHETLIPDLASDLDLREHIKQVAWYKVAKATRGRLLVYWEQSWHVMPGGMTAADLQRPMRQINEGQIEEMASHLLGRPGSQFDALIYQIECLCLHRIENNTSGGN